MAKKDVLIIVDWQNDFVNGALGFEGAEKLDSGIKELLEKYLKNENGVIICTFDTHFEDTYMDTQEGKKLPVPHCFRGTTGWQMFGETGKLIDDITHVRKTNAQGVLVQNSSLGERMVIGERPGTGNCVYQAYTDKYKHDKLLFVEKPTFPSAHLARLLQGIGLEDKTTVGSVTLVGLVTNMCVMGNAVVAKAACPEAEIIIKKDLVDSFDKELHQKALDVMASMQMTVE